MSASSPAYIYPNISRVALIRWNRVCEPEDLRQVEAEIEKAAASPEPLRHVICSIPDNLAIPSDPARAELKVLNKLMEKRVQSCHYVLEGTSVKKVFQRTIIECGLTLSRMFRKFPYYFHDTGEAAIRSLEGPLSLPKDFIIERARREGAIQ